MLEFFFPIILGLIISYEDFKESLIKNKYIVILIIYGILFQLSFGIFTVVFLKFMIFSFFISFLFWHLGLWSAADGKLFFALSLILPTSLYVRSSLITDYLTNVFVPIFLFITAFLLIRSKRKVIEESLKHTFKPYNFLIISVIFIGFASLLAKLFGFFGIPTNFLIYIIFMFIAYEILIHFFTAKIEMFFILLAIIRIIIDYKEIYTISFLYNFTITVVLFLFFRFFILRLAFKSYTKNVKINNLEEGMILAEGIVNKKGKIEKLNLFQSSLIQTLQQKKYKYIHELGEITKEDIKKIKKLKKNNKIKFDDILVYQKQPFAIFLLVGYILTILFNGSFVSWLRTFI